MFNFDWCSNIPLTWAKILVIMAFIIPLVFAFTLKHKYIYQGAQDEKPWRNLKIWVLLLVVTMVGIYLYF